MGVDCAYLDASPATLAAASARLGVWTASVSVSAGAFVRHLGGGLGREGGKKRVSEWRRRWERNTTGAKSAACPAPAEVELSRATNSSYLVLHRISNSISPSLSPTSSKMGEIHKKCQVPIQYRPIFLQDTPYVSSRGLCHRPVLHPPPAAIPPLPPQRPTPSHVRASRQRRSWRRLQLPAVPIHPISPRGHRERGRICLPHCRAHLAAMASTSILLHSVRHRRRL